MFLHIEFFTSDLAEQQHCEHNGTNLNSKHFQKTCVQHFERSQRPVEEVAREERRLFAVSSSRCSHCCSGLHFFVIFISSGKGNVYHVYVELIELICLPSMFTVNCVLASLENVQRRRESQQSRRRVERSVRDSQENFQIKAGRVLALGASRKQLSHCGKKQNELQLFDSPFTSERLSNFFLFFFISAALLLRLAYVVMAFYECSDMASTQKHTDIML